MATDLKQHLSTIAADRTPIWIDATKYGQKLLNNDKEIAWEDIGACVSYHRQLQGLINSDVIAVQVGDFYRNWFDRHPALKSTMKEKKRLGYALRTLLADLEAKKQLNEFVKALCDCYPDTPVTLVLPSPKQWMKQAYCYARDCDTVDVSWEDAESASMYMADFLRNFSDCDISAILLSDQLGDGVENDLHLQAYQPVINTAEHYRWQIVLSGALESFRPKSDSGICFNLCSSYSSNTGVFQSAAEWKNSTLPLFSGEGFLFVEVPKDAVPEEVLEELDHLRKTGG
jgi:hypothetical protein